MHKGTYQSKSNGIASEPTFSLKTFWNFSYVIVPESSLAHAHKYEIHNAQQYLPRDDSHVEVLECDPVICIGPLQNGLEHDKIIPRHESPLGRVRHAEEYGELRASKLGEVARRRNGGYELLLVQKPANIADCT